MNDEQKFIKRNLIVKDDFASIDDYGWDGFANSLDLFNEMKRQGWKLIASNVIYDKHMGGKNMAENTCIELLFERINKNV